MASIALLAAAMLGAAAISPTTSGTTTPSWQRGSTRGPAPMDRTTLAWWERRNSQTRRPTTTTDPVWWLGIATRTPTTIRSTTLSWWDRYSRRTKQPSTTTYPTMISTRRPWQRGTTVPWWERYRHGTRKPTTTTDPLWWLRSTQNTHRPSRSTADWTTTRPTTSPSSYDWDGDDDYDEGTTTRRPTTTSPSSYDWDGDYDYDEGTTTGEYDWTTPWQPMTTGLSEDGWNGEDDNDYDWTTPWLPDDDYEREELRRASRLSRSGVILGGLIGGLVVTTIIVVILYLGFTRRHRPSATPLPFNSSLFRVDLEPTVNPAGPLLSAELPPYSNVSPPAYSSADVPPQCPEASVHVAGTPQVTLTPDESKAIAGQVSDV